MKIIKNIGLSFSEVVIAFTIISTLFVTFLGLTYNYFIILVTAKERLIALSLAQEGLELATALRNKQYEKTYTNNWLGVETNKQYCIDFNTSSGKIITSTPLQSQPNGCVVFNSQSNKFERLISYSETDPLIIITSTVTFGNQSISLDTVLTDWK